METQETQPQPETQNPKEPIISRLLYSVLILIIEYFISTVVFVTTVFQFIYTAILGKSQERVQKFTANLAHYAKDVINYLTFNSEKKPWPMGEWDTNK